LLAHTSAPIHLCIIKQNKQNKQKQQVMKKIIIAAAAIIGFSAAANAQTVNSTNATGNAQQTVQLALSNALEITFTANNSATGATVTLPFTTTNDYANGVESATQQLKVRSNKEFNVTVKTSAANFSVTNGTTTTTSSMPASVLGLVVTDNNTGGNLGTGFSASTYKALSATAATLISAGDNGGNQNFTVKYKATPGFAYSAGVYSTDVVYTATQQ
jgi:hypothetical protein